MKAFIGLSIICLYCATVFADSETTTQPSSGSFPWSVLGEIDDRLPVERKCTCLESLCQCCVDFNVTFVDLGGPGCVKMKYLSRDEGMLVNVSYGDSQLHGEIIKGPNPQVTCMDVLSDLAQICAKISDIEANDDGMKSCIALSPTLLGEAQENYDLGCFVMDPSGMRQVPGKPSQIPDEEETTSESTTTNEEALIAAVNESAEESIAWFSSLLGLSFGNNDKGTTSNSNSTQN